MSDLLPRLSKSYWQRQRPLALTLMTMLATLVVIITADTTCAQTTWEVTPYQVKILLASDRSPNWSPVVLGR